MELPTFIQLEPVGQCNLRCEMCPIQFRQDGPPYGPPAFMPFETFTRFIDQLPDLKELQLQGLGEPMMHPRFFDMVEYAAQRGVQVGTNSNMTLLRTSKRAERLVQCGLEWLHVSIDGVSPEVYEAIRVRSKLARVLENLELVVEAKKRLSSRTPQLRLVMVLMRKNLHELPGVVRLAARFGIETMFVQHLCHDFGESSLPAHYRPMREFVQRETLLEEDPDRVDLFFDAARATAEEHGINLRLPKTRMTIHPPDTPGRQRCDWPWHGPYVSFDGQAMPCCMVATPDRASLGDMAGQGIEPIWSGAAYESFRAQLDSEEPPEVCRSCSVYTGTF